VYDGILEDGLRSGTEGTFEDRGVSSSSGSASSLVLVVGGASLLSTLVLNLARDRETSRGSVECWVAVGAVWASR